MTLNSQWTKRAALEKGEKWEWTKPKRAALKNTERIKIMDNRKGREKKEEKTGQQTYHKTDKTGEFTQLNAVYSFRHRAPMSTGADTEKMRAD